MMLPSEIISLELPTNGIGLCWKHASVSGSEAGHSLRSVDSNAGSPTCKVARNAAGGNVAGGNAAGGNAAGGDTAGSNAAGRNAAGRDAASRDAANPIACV